MSGGTGTFGTLGYLQREAILMQEERDRFLIVARSFGLDWVDAERALAESDRRARESLFGWRSTSRDVLSDIAAGEVKW